MLFDYESKSSYTIRVRTTDSGGFFFEQSFTITATNLYEAPTGVVVGSDGPDSDGNPATLDITENAPAGATVATLALATPNSGSTYTYTLVASAGDNTLFTLTNGTLTVNNPFDYERPTAP